MSTQRMARTITWQNYQHDGDTYWITVRFWDETRQSVTAKWRRHSDGKTGELDYEIDQCDAAIYQAEQLIQKQRLEERA